MTSARPPRPSVQVLAGGLGASVVSSLLLSAGAGMGAGDAVIALVGGAAASAGCVAASVGQDRRRRSTEEHLERTEQRAITDPLTGLLNRAGMFAALHQAQAEVKRSGTVMGVLFLDLDRFKVINDSMGHDVGDELLRIVADRLRGIVSRSDVVARFGGDEFVVVTQGLLSERSVIQVARQILTAFAQPISLHGAAQVVSTSIGVAVVDADDQRSVEDLIRDADAAMFKAKRNRSGYAVFDEVERLRAVDRLDTERDLVTALADGQLIVHYQPIVSLPDLQVVGFEALVRWNHPSRGLLTPAAFLDVAEEAGLMSVIGELVLREACAQKAVWNHLSARARTMTVSVNLAEQQLLDARFPDQVAAILDWSGLAPSQLRLEITEGVIASHLGDLKVLRRLRDLGVSFAIDDFGTGQSSLSVLRQLDMITVLKIDKEFVNGLSRGAADGAIVEAVVTMAAALGLEVVAEGVEDEGQLDQLRALGVDMIQGYLFDRPMAAHDIAPGLWGDRRTKPREGLVALEISRSLMEEPRSRSAPRRLRPRPVPGPGRS